MNGRWRPATGSGPDVAELMELDGPPETSVDRIPSAAQEMAGCPPLATYRDWTPDDTKIVMCRINNDVYPGTRYDTRDQALAAVRLVHGQILEANYVPGRAFFRVRKLCTKQH